MPKQTFFNLPQEKRDAILDVAIEAFAESEYNSVSISRLVEQAGIAKGSFYQYFADKEDLFLYLLDLAAQEKRAFVQKQPPPDPDMGLFDYMRWLFHVTVRFEFSRPKLARVGYRALYGDLPFSGEVHRRMESVADAYYRELIDMGVAQGAVDPEIDRDLAAFVLSATLGELGSFLMRHLGLSPRRMAEEGYEGVDMAAVYDVIDRLLVIFERGMGR